MTFDKEVDMRPIGTLFWCIAAFAASLASAQTNQNNYPAPTIHNSGQHSAVVPLPPLGTNAAPSADQALNASWVGSTSRVVPANYTAPSNPDSPNTYTSQSQAAAQSSSPSTALSSSQATARRTPLNPRSSAIATEDNKSGKVTHYACCSPSAAAC